MTAPGRGRLDAFLVLVLTLGAALWMTRAHWESVDLPKESHKLRLHGQVLENEAPDPYQYKNTVLAHALELVHDRTGVSRERVFLGNTLLSLLFLTLLHHLWLRQFGSPTRALAGTLLLAALANVLFRTYYHHPYEFWGVGLFCLLLVGLDREWSIGWLCLLGLVAGLVWEKHALLAPIWGLLALRRGERFWPSFGKGLLFLACCLAVPVAVRIVVDHGLTSPRSEVDGDTTLAMQKWGTVAWYQGSYLLPFLAVFLLRFRRMPLLVRLLWLYLPVLVAAYLYKQYIVHEVRSFWALVPVFTATVVVWLAGPDRTEPTAAAEPAPAPAPAR